jgi:hypothetical protein
MAVKGLQAILKAARVLQLRRAAPENEALPNLFYCRRECAGYTSHLPWRIARGIFMQTIDRKTMRYRVLSLRTARWLVALKAAVVAIMLVGLPPAANAAPAPSRVAPAPAHVYLVRGLLNVFSLGMDQMAYKLEQQGISASVHNHLLWASVADDAAAAYKSGRIKTIILVGHSSGATCLPDIVARLSAQGVPVKLAIGLDSVFHTSLTGKVGRYVNFYIANGAGTRVERTKNFSGTLDNVDVERVPGISHVSIDKNEIIQQKVIAEIDAAVASGPSAEPEAPRLPGPAARASGSRRAAN